MQYKILDWDTDFFGFKVGRITKPHLEVQELYEILSEMQKENVKLVYFPAKKEIEFDIVKDELRQKKERYRYVVGISI